MQLFQPVIIVYIDIYEVNVDISPVLLYFRTKYLKLVSHFNRNSNIIYLVATTTFLVQ